MASSGLVISELGRVSGCLPSTVDRMLRDLRANGMAPMGQPGRGQDHGQYDPAALTKVIIAFAGPQPSDAAEAVRRLHDLTSETGGQLGADIQKWIELAAACLDGDPQADIEDVPFSISMSYDAPLASAEWMLADGMTRRMSRYIKTHGFKGGAVTRTTHVHRPVILTCGELWHGVVTRRRGSVPPASPQVAPASAASKTKTAALPARRAAAYRDQPEKPKLDDASQAHPARERAKSQPRSVSPAGRPHQQRRRADRDDSGNDDADLAVA